MACFYVFSIVSFDCNDEFIDIAYLVVIGISQLELIKCIFLLSNYLYVIYTECLAIHLPKRKLNVSIIF